jgi:plasmid maintenance system antidote protein VapI
MAETLRPDRDFKVVAKLARMIGISRPQMHNVLKGCRTLKPDLADLLIAQLGIPIASLGIGMA